MNPYGRKMPRSSSSSTSSDKFWMRSAAGNSSIISVEVDGPPPGPARRDGGTYLPASPAAPPARVTPGHPAATWSRRCRPTA